MKKILLALALVLLPISAYAAFDDVPTDHEFADAITYLEENGLVEGFADNTYRPDQTITRAEFAKILLLAEYDEETILACEGSGFADVSEDAWYLPYVCFAQANAIVKGYPDNTFAPNKTIIFAEAAKIIVNTLIEVQAEGEGEDWWKPFVDKLAEENAAPDSITDETHLITRGEMAEIIYRLETEAASEDDSDTETKIFDGQGDTEEASENIAAFEGDTNPVRFEYATQTETGAMTTVIEDETHVIVATADLQTDDFEACADLGYCSETDDTRYEHLDSFYVLMKNADTSFEDSIKAKITAAGKDANRCEVKEVDSPPEGWTKAIVEPSSFDSFVIDEAGIAYDKENVELSDYQMKQLREQEAVEKCSYYAGGFGGSFFLFSEEKSEKYYLFVPSYGDTERLIDFKSVEF